MSAPDGPERFGGAGSYDVRPQPDVRRRGHPWLRTLTVVVVGLIALDVAGSMWTRHLWFASTGFSDVYSTQLRIKAWLFLGAALATEVLCRGGMWLAYKLRPIVVPDAAGEAMHRYRVSVEPFRRGIFLVLPLMSSVLIGASASARWRVPLLWSGRVPFGRSDPQFHRDFGFYVFTLPWIQLLIGLATAVLVVALLLATVTHYVYGGITLRGGRVLVTRFARNHLCLLAIALLLVRAASWWFSRYAVVYRTGRSITGVDYVGVHALVPVRGILALCAVLTALTFVPTLRTGNWRLPVSAVTMLTACGIVFGGIYPDVLAALEVGSADSARQTRYVEEHLAATRSAYGVDDVRVQSVGQQTAASGVGTAATGVPVMDPAYLASAFQKLQRLGPVDSFGAFPDTGVEGAGQSIPTVKAARGVDVSDLPASGRNWRGRHVVYTHGTGIVTARGDQASPAGDPVSITRPEAAAARVYFGEGLPAYSVVGARPVEADGSSDTGYRYDGGGGVALGGVLRRLAYAGKFRSSELLTSKDVTARSRIIYDRDPVTRVRQVAPWLTVDDDSYPVTSGDRALWVVDGYTTTDRYPFSHHEPLTGTPRGGSAQVNYVRNAVKATVDAYDGTVRLYAWDSSDPILRAWENVFPGTVLARSSMPKAVATQVRYPRQLFDLQRSVLGAYHPMSAADFQRGSDRWTLPADPTSGAAVTQPAVYTPVRLPGATSSTYSLTGSYVDRSGMGGQTGLLVAGSDPASGYGLLTLLRTPGATGPGQFQTRVNSSQQRSSTLPGTLAQYFVNQSKGGARATRGGIVTVPTPAGLMHVEPVFVRPSGGASHPQLKAVVVGTGTHVAWGRTLQAAIADLDRQPSG